MVQVVLVACCLTSCNYLDVIPPAQADFEDTMKDENTTLAFLYSGYYGVVSSNPIPITSFENSTDETAQPQLYSTYPQQMAWGTLSPSYSAGWGGEDYNIWVPSYNHIGYVHYFLDLIDDMQPIGVTQEDKEEYKAECYFLEAYYHFRVLQAFGPDVRISTIVWTGLWISWIRLPPYCPLHVPTMTWDAPPPPLPKL